MITVTYPNGKQIFINLQFEISGDENLVESMKGFLKGYDYKASAESGDPLEFLYTGLKLWGFNATYDKKEIRR